MLDSQILIDDQWQSVCAEEHHCGERSCDSPVPVLIRMDLSEAMMKPGRDDDRIVVPVARKPIFTNASIRPPWVIGLLLVRPLGEAVSPGVFQKDPLPLSYPGAWLRLHEVHGSILLKCRVTSRRSQSLTG